MWAVLDLNGDPLATFKAGLDGWQRAVRYAERNGGEFDIVFMPYLEPARKQLRRAA